jgi:hypothetical protein
VKKPAMMFPIQQAMCTEGPSLPTVSPDAIMSGFTRISSRSASAWAPTYKSDRLDDESRETQEVTHYDTCQDALDLRYTGARSILGHVANKM